MNLLQPVFAPRERGARFVPSPGTGRPAWRIRRYATLLLVLLLIGGLLTSGAAHEAFHHHDHEEGGDCFACHLTGFEPTTPPAPLVARVFLARASTPRVAVPESRLGRSGTRPRAPPSAA